MRKRPVPILLAVAGAFAAAVVIGCASQPSLEQIRPETRERMEMVMVKIGQYYELLDEAVETGNLSQAVTPAEAIAALGAHLAPHRDPGMPDRYIAMQARFDEAARELAQAARLKSLQEVSQLFGEMRHTCRACHQEYRVRLGSPYRDLGYGG